MDRHASEEKKPGWIVDGQQRSAAIVDSRLTAFPVCVVAFITPNAQDQREQFILVNSTKPLPKGLLYELLHTTDVALPAKLSARRFPASLMEALNYEPSSPFHERIQTTTNPEGYIKDNSILKMLENSLSQGILYWYRDSDGRTESVDAMLVILHSFWAVVAELFPDAWNLPPRRSRLTHGAGIVGMGMLMDAIADGFRNSGPPSSSDFKQQLEPLRESCFWTQGFWQFRNGERRKWNDLQNTSKDIQLLADHLLHEYKTRVLWTRSVRKHNSRA
jgi:DGQHR domain-containing protein